MKREEAKKKAEIMLAYAEGKKIQFLRIGTAHWLDIESPEFTLDSNRYRIKPEQNAKAVVNSDGSYSFIQDGIEVKMRIDENGNKIILTTDTCTPCIKDEKIGLYVKDKGFFEYKEGTKFEKPEPKYRPFKSAEEVMEAIKEHGDWVKYDYGYYRITYFGHDSVQVSDCDVESFMKAFKELTWSDGTPFGKLEE